jgi:hypothetical protein
MSVQEIIVETVEYRLILLLPESRKILAISDVDGYRLPSVTIPQWTRPAQQLQEAVLGAWGLPILILDLFFQDSSHCAVAEALAPAESRGLKPVLFEQIQTSELPEAQRAQISSLLAGNLTAISPLSHLGWIDQAIAWVEAETGRKLSSKRYIEQYNAGGGFSLIRFCMEDGRKYWLKATAEPNAHEPSITAFLSKLCGSYLPEFVSSKPEWNAWLMSGDATCVKAIPSDPLELFPLLEDAVESMAKLQMKTLGYNLDLLSVGAFDQGLLAFQRHSTELFDYIEEAMSLQVSTKVPRLEKKRIKEIHAIFEDVCSYMEELDLPDTIVHGDLNRGNILIGHGHCQFIDWCEANVANPLISLQHLLLFNKVEGSETRHQINLLLKQRYLDIWAASYNPDTLARGFVLMPILAAASALYGRGDWFTSHRQHALRLHGYARTLARCMDRAAQDLAHGGSLCA